jgi:ribosomal protein S18 acetylase RimI-like enzyme
MYKTINEITTQSIPEVLDIPGLVFRNFRGESDFPRMLEISEGSKHEDGLEYTDTLEELKVYYANLNNSDPFKDMLFVEVNGEAVGFSRAMWDKRTTGEYVYSHFARLLPSWRDSGIRVEMLKHNERRLREYASEHPEDVPKIFQSWAADTETHWSDMIKQAGYKPVRYFYEMLRSTDEYIPEAPMPDGLVVRLVREDNFRQIWEAANEAFADHWGYVPGTENDYQCFKNAPNNRPELWKVAWDGDQVAGMVLNFISEEENLEYNRKRGYTEDISVRQPWRNRGLARSLLVQSIQMFKEMDFEETCLGVDTQNLNGALRLYEGVGYKPIKRFANYNKPLEIE